MDRDTFVVQFNKINPENVDLVGLIQEPTDNPDFKYILRFDYGTGRVSGSTIGVKTDETEVEAMLRALAFFHSVFR